MTISEAINHIYLYLSSEEPNGVFKFSEFLGSTVNITKLEKEELISIYKLALEDLEKADFLKKIPNSETWVLKTPVKALKQSVELSGSLCALVAELNNKIAEMLQDNYQSNVLDITENDVRYLALFVHDTLKSIKKDE